MMMVIILGSLLLLPLFRCESLLAESVDGLQLLLQGRVDQPMPCQQGLALKLVAHYHHFKFASTAVRHVGHLHMLGSELLLEFGPQVLLRVATHTLKSFKKCYQAM